MAENKKVFCESCKFVVDYNNMCYSPRGNYQCKNKEAHITIEKKKILF